MTLCGTVMSPNNFRQPFFVQRPVALGASDGRTIDLRKNITQRMIDLLAWLGSKTFANDVGLGNVAGLRFVLNLSHQRFWQADGQCFHRYSVRQWWRICKTIRSSDPHLTCASQRILRNWRSGASHYY